MTLAAVALTVAIVAIAASIWPTWKASKVDPVSVLKAS
jgi:ABC-type lipoprotein release transport system permease subunit